MTKALGPLPQETLDAIAAAVARGFVPLRAEPPVPLSEWAEEHFKLTAESSQQVGDWVCWSFQRGIADMMSDDRIEELAVEKSKRVGYTKLLTAFVAYTLVHRRRSAAIWQPTDDDRDSFVKTELDPVFDEIDVVKAARRPKLDSLKLRMFLGAVLHTLGGRAARAYRRITVALAALDEWDAFDQSIEGSGTPDGLAKGRLEGAPYPKFIGGSTPRLKGLSHVSTARQQAEADMRFHVECPHCGVEHPLSWGGPKVQYGFKWTRGMPETVRHVCPHCLGEMRQADYLPGGLPMPGVWVCGKTGVRYGMDRVWRDAAGNPIRPPRTVGIQVWSAYSPQRSWVSIVREFEQAKAQADAGNTEALQTFVNETLGEVWEVKGDSADEHELSRRAEDYELRQVPIGALFLTAGVDVQDNRFEITVWGWGRGLESWLVDFVVLDANPADQRDWDKLDGYLQTRYRQLYHGGTLAIDATAIDTGGHFTHQVYDFARTRVHRRVFAIAGSPKYGGPVKGPGRRQDVNWQGKVLKAGVVRWEIGTDTAKDLIYGRLQVPIPGPGYVHFPKGLPASFYAGLTAESRLLQKTSTGEVYRWVKIRTRNEPLDCTVYATWGTFMLDLHRYTETMWDRREALVQPPRDLFAPSLDLESEPELADLNPPPDNPQPAVTPVRPPARRPASARAW